MKSFNSILIPNWIEHGLLASDKDLSDIVSYDVVRQVLSPEDVLFLLKFQAVDLSTLKSEAFSAGIEVLANYWKANTTHHDELRTVIELAYNGIKQYETFLTSVLTRFQTAALPNENDSSFELHDLSKNLGPDNLVFAICLGSGSLSGELGNVMQADIQFNLTESLLKVLYSRLPTTQVALLPITRQYVELMKTRVNISTM